MTEYIEKQAAISEILGQLPEAHYPTWYAEQIKAIQPADVRPAIEISDAVDEAIRILNAINTSGRLDYSDYCELHDAICSIWIRGENNAEMG